MIQKFFRSNENYILFSLELTPRAPALVHIFYNKDISSQDSFTMKLMMKELNYEF